MSPWEIDMQKTYNRLTGGSNSAQGVSVYTGDPLTGPASIDTGYQFGDYLGGGASAKTQQQNQANMDYAEWVRNEASAKEQRAWEERMSNTQVQRAMKDIEAAGLNPWLAVQSAGFGSVVPQGAAASSSAGQASASGASPAAAIGMGLASAYGVIKIVKAIAKVIK